MWKTILFYFALGLFVFFALSWLLTFFVGRFPFIEKETIGILGAYTPDNLPQAILFNLSRGLTMVGHDGTAKRGAAKNWKIENNGKTYTFYLDPTIHFTDGTRLTSDWVDYGFSDVEVKKIDQYTISFTLKNPYAPFLLTVSRPIFKKGLIGIGEYKVKKISLKNNFVETLELRSTKYNKDLIYQFYPTEKALKVAFALLEVSKIESLMDDEFKDRLFSEFKNVRVEKKPNYNRLVTLFYNTKDKAVSSKTLREALSYTIPDHFKEGERSTSPFFPSSFAREEGITTSYQDLEHAKSLLAKTKEQQNSEKISITISTLPSYQKVTANLESIWKALGIETKIKIVEQIPSSFQIFLGDFNLSKDPDQYVLWHSSQITNITHYNNLRIDKLLEDGRQTTDIAARKKIYAEFQKYILADPPASFLFFPYAYDISRK